MTEFQTILMTIIALCAVLGSLGLIFRILLNSQTKSINAKIDPIEKLLSNHITDTNKKIDKLSETIKEDKKELKEEMKDGFKNITSRLDKALQDKQNKR